MAVTGQGEWRRTVGARALTVTGAWAVATSETSVVPHGSTNSCSSHPRRKQCLQGETNALQDGDFICSLPDERNARPTEALDRNGLICTRCGS